MRNIIAVILCVMLAPWGVCFSQDNIYGDYLIYSLEKNVSLDLESAQLVDVLKLLSQQTRLNFVSTEAVRDRELTLYIENIPLKEAMNIIFKANNLTYDYYPDSNIFVVKEMGKPTLEVKTKVYRLKYVRIDSGRMQTEIDSVMGTGEEGEDDGEGDGEGEEEEAEGIKGAVQAVLTENGKVTVDPITNSLIVVDVPSRFPLIDEVVRELDVPIPKVLIEVEMLDVAKGAVDKFGVNWPETIASLTVSGTRATSFPFGGTGGHGYHFDVPENAYGGGWNWPDWSAAKFGPSVQTVIGAHLALDFFKSQNDTKFLGRPKILTLSNETAEIKITTDEAIGVTETIGGQADTTTFDVERTETGIRLRVTPQVDSVTGDITLFVEMVNRIATNSDFVLGGEEAVTFISGTIKNPEERSTTATVRLKDGECLFMGGLIRKTETEAETKVPIVGDIPFIGRMFRHNDRNIRESELLVFITPRVVEDAAFRAGSARRGPATRREQGNLAKRNAVTLALDSFCY